MGKATFYHTIGTMPYVPPPGRYPLKRLYKITVRHSVTVFAWRVKIKPQCSSRTYIPMYQTIRCPKRDRILNLHHCEHLKCDTKDYSEQLNCEWKYQVGKTKLRGSAILLYTHTYTPLKTTYSVESSRR